MSYNSIVVFGLVVLAGACERPNPLYLLEGAHRDGGGVVDDAGGGAAADGFGDGGAARDAGAGVADGAGARPAQADAGTGTAPGTGRDSGPDSSSTAPLADAATAPLVWKGDVSSGMALYLPLDEGSGQSVLHDASGMKGVAALKTVDAMAAWGLGRFGSSLALQGPSWSGYLAVSASPIEAVALEKFSIAMWIFRADDSSGSLMSRRYSGVNGYLFNLALENGSLAMRINSSAGYNAHVVGNGTVPMGRWVHVAMTYDLKLVHLYVDADEVGVGTYQMAVPLDTTTILVGGAEQANGTVTARFTGKVDDVLVYTRALAQQDVQDLSDGSRPPVR